MVFSLSVRPLFSCKVPSTPSVTGYRKELYQKEILVESKTAKSNWGGGRTFQFIEVRKVLYLYVVYILSSLDQALDHLPA